MHGHSRSIRFTGCTLLALLLAAATLPSPAQATTTTWKVRANTTLTDNFFGTIEIVKDGVTLDCDSYKVTGDGHGRGIVLDKRDGVTVRNCDVSNFADGIWVAGTTKSVFVGNYAHHNLRGPEEGWVQGEGFWVQTSSGNQFLDNHMSDNSSDGFGMRNSSDNVVTGNTVADNGGAGFWIETSEGNRFTGNTAQTSGAWGFILFRSSANTLISNASDGNGFAGFLVDGKPPKAANDNTLEGNTASGNSGSGFEILENASANVLTDNEATSNGAGFWIGDGATGNTLEGNTASDSGYDGFVLAAASDNTLVENVAQDNVDRGFIVDAASGNHLDENTSTGNGQGGFLVNNQATGNTLTGNWAYDNADGGFVIAAGSSDNTLSGNHGSSNVYGFLAADGATANTFQENDAHGNTVWDAAQDGTSAGNFWIDNCFGTFYGIPDQTACSNDAMVRVLHASPDAPAVDIYVNGDKVGDPLAGLEFGDLSAYVKLPAGTYDLKVCATADATVCPIVADGVALAAGTHYTIAATNVLASIEAQIITDTPSPKAGKTQVRVVHFSADTPAVDVLTQDGSAKVVENLSYPDKTDYLTLAPGSYDLKVCATADNTVCPLDPGPLALEAATSYSVFAIGSLEGETLTAAVGVDGVAAPATDTVGATETSTTTTSFALLLLVAGIASFVGAMRLATSRARR